MIYWGNMLTSAECLRVIGEPEKENGMVVWYIPESVWFASLPRRIYCNVRLVKPLEAALTKIRDRELQDQVKTWDGCFNIRKKRGAVSSSLHSWGVAIDINAAWNGFKKPPTMSRELVACFTESGFDWGGTWSKPDGMHFQLRTL